MVSRNNRAIEDTFQTKLVPFSILVYSKKSEVRKSIHLKHEVYL